MKYIKIILTIIAILLGMINFKLWTWQNISTRGDLIALREAKSPDARMRLLKNIPIIWVQGGDIDANVSGSVSIDGSVTIEQ
jgi:hypothetical protein